MSTGGFQQQHTADPAWLRMLWSISHYSVNRSPPSSSISNTKLSSSPIWSCVLPKCRSSHLCRLHALCQDWPGKKDLSTLYLQLLGPRHESKEMTKAAQWRTDWLWTSSSWGRKANPGVICQPPRECQEQSCMQKEGTDCCLHHKWTASLPPAGVSPCQRRSRTNMQARSL